MSCLSVSLSVLCELSVLSCPVLSCPVLSCPVLSCPVLSCPVLSCPVLSCLLSLSLSVSVSVLSVRSVCLFCLFCLCPRPSVLSYCAVRLLSIYAVRLCCLAERNNGVLGRALGLPSLRTGATQRTFSDLIHS